ncbi:hypothetical protein HYS96_02110 [Candidatus Daviesbacteria bacterium]|nr:hypothetical protein [Candidatus Daviesbacteria bacterium]
MDNARDLIDVREMIVLKKLRLIGPSTAIEGFFNGPAWYYLLAIPFVLSQGDPYSTIILQIIFWVIGGYFLLKIVSKWSMFLVVPIGFLWIASDYINLATSYVFNPNPITLLTPLFIYLLYKYTETNKLIFAALTFLLGGLFFNFEMNFGIFIPVIIFFSILLSKKAYFLKGLNFWIGASFYVICLMPQIIFNFKHNLLISNAVINHLQRESKSVDFPNRFQSTTSIFYNIFIPTILNRKLLAFAILIFSMPVLLKFIRQGHKDPIVIISLCYIFIPFTFYLFLPVTVSPWHLGGIMSASIILVGFLLRKLWEFNLAGKLISLSLAILIFYFSLFNIFKFLLVDIKIPNMDPALFKNEVAAIDYVYKYANGKNFKVYTYLPSIIDYPYQYLIWWYGLKEYGFLPIEYAYAKNKPEYISNKAKFSETEEKLKLRENSNLIFLIKEPNRNYTRFGWEGDFVKFETVDKHMVGPLEIEVKTEVSQ